MELDLRWFKPLSCVGKVERCHNWGICMDLSISMVEVKGSLDFCCMANCKKMWWFDMEFTRTKKMDSITLGFKKKLPGPTGCKNSVIYITAQSREGSWRISIFFFCGERVAKGRQNSADFKSLKICITNQNDGVQRMSSLYLRTHLLTHCWLTIQGIHLKTTNEEKTTHVTIKRFSNTTIESICINIYQCLSIFDHPRNCHHLGRLTLT